MQLTFIRKAFNQVGVDLILRRNYKLVFLVNNLVLFQKEQFPVCLLTVITLKQLSKFWFSCLLLCSLMLQSSICYMQLEQRAVKIIESSSKDSDRFVLLNQWYLEIKRKLIHLSEVSPHRCFFQSEARISFGQIYGSKPLSLFIQPNLYLLLFVFFAKR